MALGKGKHCDTGRIPLSRSAVNREKERALRQSEISYMFMKYLTCDLTVSSYMRLMAAIWVSSGLDLCLPLCIRSLIISALC